ncbi:hypothetical protein [Algoriphagus namhaensis]
MKKLSLEMLRLSTNEILERSQMKKITGGYGSSGTCGFITADGSSFCGVSKSVAISNAGQGGNWCCDSCGSSSYCGPGSGWEASI